MSGLSINKQLPVEILGIVLRYATDSKEGLATIEQVCALWKNLSQKLWGELAEKCLPASYCSHLSLTPYAAKEQFHILSNWHKGKCRINYSEHPIENPYTKSLASALPSYFSPSGDFAIYNIPSKRVVCTIGARKRLGYDDVNNQKRIGYKTKHTKVPTTLIFVDPYFVSRSKAELIVHKKVGDNIYHVKKIAFKNENRALYIVDNTALSLGSEEGCLVSFNTFRPLFFATPDLTLQVLNSETCQVAVGENHFAILCTSKRQDELCLYIYDIHTGEEQVSKRWSPLARRGASISYLQFFNNLLIGVIKGDNTLCIWETTTGNCLFYHSARKAIHHVSFSGTSIRAKIGDVWTVFDFASSIEKREKVAPREG